MTGIKLTTTLERTLYLDLPENASKEEINKAAEQEIMLPHKALLKAAEILRRANIIVDGLDLSDWSLVNSEFTIV